jgi:hypothetical protein
MLLHPAAVIPVKYVPKDQYLRSPIRTRTATADVRILRPDESPVKEIP